LHPMERLPLIHINPEYRRVPFIYVSVSDGFTGSASSPIAARVIVA
jgi:hypothetical protein